MKEAFSPHRLDIPAFARADATLTGAESVQQFVRLRAESAVRDSVAPVHWSAHGDMRSPSGAAPIPWLHLKAECALPLVCQRCLQPVETPLQVDRWFRFVADEDTAALEDQEVEEDVLVSQHDFDLHALIEDELLMEIPFAPMHAVCPAPVALSAADADFEAAVDKPNPFAALAQLKKSSSGETP